MTNTEWVAITCAEADALRPRLRPNAGRSDLGGEFGEPEVYTEWGLDDGTPVMREHRYPNLDGTRPDRRPCEHYQAGSA